jgi:methylase of polypeptide subunit release factors
MLNAARLLQEVAATGYRFATPTPLTHERVLERRGPKVGTSLRDVFGWNLPFEASALTLPILSALKKSGFLLHSGLLLRSGVRIASLDDDLFLHSAYPTLEEDAVFFGPDTYRFGNFIRQTLALRLPEQVGLRPFRVLDVGCGSGAGGTVVARALALAGPAIEVTLNDINPLALQYASVNAQAAGLSVKLAEGDALSAVKGEFDIIVSNPPYLNDAAERAYRHGGDRLGRALSVRIATESLPRLAPGGQLLLYTGVAIVDGVDPFLEEIRPLLESSRHQWSYTEIDPDVFGEELDRSVYADADRIAVVGLVVTRARRL